MFIKYASGCLRLSFIFAPDNYREQKASLAQLVEQLTRNEQVVGSSPMGGSERKPGHSAWVFFFGNICRYPACLTFLNHRFITTCPVYSA